MKRQRYANMQAGAIKVNAWGNQIICAQFNNIQSQNEYAQRVKLFWPACNLNFRDMCHKKYLSLL